MTAKILSFTNLQIGRTMSVFLIAALTGCAQAPKSQEDRLPSQEQEDVFEEAKLKPSAQVATGDVVQAGDSAVAGKFCGLLFYPESSYSAFDENDVKYILAVDKSELACASDKIQKSNRKYRVHIRREATKNQQQRGHLTRWLSRGTEASIQSKSRRRDTLASYVCFRGQVGAAVCDSRNRDVEAKFTKNFTANEKTYQSWPYTSWK